MKLLKGSETKTWSESSNLPHWTQANH